MNKKNLIRLILIICFSSIHYAISQYVWDNLNERTKQAFEKAGAKNNLLLASNSSKKWLHPDNETRRQVDSKKFGGGHGNVKANVKATTYYLKLAENHYIKGTATDIQKSAYYIGYALDFIGDSLTPVSGVNDKIITAPAKRYYNINIPFNGNSKDVIKNNKYISFGKPRTFTLTELGLTKSAFLNKEQVYNDIVELVKKADKVNQVGSKVLTDTNNIAVLKKEWGEWRVAVIAGQINILPNYLENYREGQKLMLKKHAAYALKAVMEYFKGTSVYGIWFSDAKAYEDLPIRPNLNKSETVVLPKKIGVETEKPQWEQQYDTDNPTTTFGNNVLIMDKDDKILSWLNIHDLDIEEKNVLGGFKTLSLLTKMSEPGTDDLLFRQGNKIFINGDSDNERCLYVFNTKITKNDTDSTINAEADEILSELNNTPPFYIYDSKWDDYRVGDTVLVSTDFLTDLLEEYYVIDGLSAIDLYDIEPAKRRIQITGTITILDLLREIESLTGCYFKRHYYIENNSVKARIQLLKPKRYGRLHTAPVEAIKLGRNTNKLEYTTNEENNAVGVAPIMNKDNEDDTKEIEYSQMVKDWMKITANTNNYGTDTSYAPSDFDTNIDNSLENWGYGLYENGESGAKIERDFKEYEYMPYILIKQYENVIPIAETVGAELSTSDQIINPQFYLGKTRPKLTVYKSPGSSLVSITIKSTSIVEDEEIVQTLTFKGNVLWDSANHDRKTGIPVDSPIIIDCDKQTIGFTRSYWTNTEVSTSKTVIKTSKSKKKTAGNTAPQKGGVHCTCGKYPWGKKYTTIFKNECPFCKAKGKTSKLKWHQSSSNSGKRTKGSANRELRCTVCGADFCGACGRDKAHSRRKTLTKVKESKTSTSTSTTSKSIKTVVNGWATLDMTVYSDDTGEDLSADNKARLSEYFTDDSSFFILHGDVAIELEGCYVNPNELFLTASNCKIYDCAEFPFVKNGNEVYFYHDKPVPFNYTKINNIPKIANVSTSSDTVEDILIDCWKYAEGKDNDTKMLELIEDIPLDLVDKTNTIYNVGDFVYLKRANNKTYEAQVTGTTKNPTKRGEGSVSVGQVRNTPINTFM